MSRKFTIGYIDHDRAVHIKYLGKSIDSVNEDFDVIFTTDERKPAQNYNDLIENCKTPYLILTHQDVSFPPNLFEAIEVTIETLEKNKRPFGVLGMTGVDSTGAYKWANPLKLHKVDTVDCCFIVFKSDTSIRFDEKTFDDYHLYIEDFCAQHNAIGLGTYTLAIESEGVLDTDWDEKTPFNKLRHHSSTISKNGFMWGRWKEYRTKLEAKWPGIKTT